MAVNPDVYECGHCGDKWPDVFLDLVPSLFGEKAECPTCHVVAEFTLVGGESFHSPNSRD